jgi:hypothetical protein
MRTALVVVDVVRRSPLFTFPVPRAVAVVVVVFAVAVEPAAVVVVPVTVDAAETTGFAAAVGVAVNAEETVADGNTVPVVAANWPGVARVAAFVGVRAVVGVVKIGAAAPVRPVVLAVPEAAVTVGTAVEAAVTLVVPVPVPVAALLITGAVAPVAAATSLPRKEPSSPPAPLEMTGVGAELMDEFTVACGLAVADGEMNWPVGAVTTATLLAAAGTAGAGPRSRPPRAASAAMVAAASSARETGDAGAGPRSTDEEYIGCVPRVPEEEPGVEDGEGLTAEAGSPLPGVRLVEQPKAARESESERAASVGKPFRLNDFVVMTLSPFRWFRSDLLRARSGPLFTVSGIF